MKLVQLTLLLASAAGAVALDRHFDIVGRIKTATAMVSANAQAAITTGGAQPKPAQPPLRKVRIVAPKPAAPTYTLTLPGRTAPLEQARISARATGIVLERNGEIGDRVKAGHVLVEIDAPEISQALERAKAAVAQVEARLVLAKATYDRAKTLVPKQFLPEQTLDDRRAAVDSARADLDAAKAEVRRLEEVQGFQTLRAPFDGVIIERNVERGDRLGGDFASTATYLYNIARLEQLRIEVDVPQSLALRIVPGTAAKMIYAELPGQTFEAKVVRTSQVVDAASSTMRAELVMDNTGHNLPAGLNVQVAFEIVRPAPCLQVPGNALLVQQGNQLVAVAEEDGTIAFRNVGIGRDLGNDVEICSGLKAEDRVIMSPNALLKAGDKVEIIPPG